MYFRPSSKGWRALDEEKGKCLGVKSERCNRVAVFTLAANAASSYSHGHVRSPAPSHASFLCGDWCHNRAASESNAMQPMKFHRQEEQPWRWVERASTGC